MVLVHESITLKPFCVKILGKNQEKILKVRKKVGAPWRGRADIGEWERERERNKEERERERAMTLSWDPRIKSFVLNELDLNSHQFGLSI